jgi:hypothetical protein
VNGGAGEGVKRAGAGVKRGVEERRHLRHVDLRIVLRLARIVGDTPAAGAHAALAAIGGRSAGDRREIGRSTPTAGEATADKPLALTVVHGHTVLGRETISHRVRAAKVALPA